MKPRNQGRIFSRKGSAFLWCAYYLRGKEYRESTKEVDEKKAEKFLRKRMDEVGADRAGKGSFIGPQQERIKVSALLDALVADFKLRGKESPQFRCQLKNIRDYFGTCLAVAVTPEGVDAYIQERLEAGFKPATINRCTQLLGQAFKLAIERKHLSTAPKVRHLSEKDNVRTGFFSDSEFSAVESFLPDHLKDFCRFAYMTGWRRGEVSSLRWEDLDGDVIKLRGVDAKNGEGRSVVLTGELVKLIERRKAARQVKTESGVTLAAHVFHTGGLPIANFRKAWWSACVSAGVGTFICPTCNQSGTLHRCPGCKIETYYSGKLFHDLRRTSVRNMVRAGVGEKVAMGISGHKTRSIFDRYNIVDEDDLRDAMQRTQDYLKSTAQGQKRPVTIRQTGTEN